MHVYFSGIGGTAIGPLAMIAHQAGFRVSGSDKQESQYVHYLRQHSLDHITIGQTYDAIAAAHARQPIDWFVYTSALPMEQPDAPELRFCSEQHIKTSKRDEFLNFLLTEKQLQLIAIAGTHGKTTTTAMAIWLLQQLDVPVSYSVGAKISFGDMGHYDPSSRYFVYEADEFDRNFLSFKPYLSLITGIDWDHPDIYPTREDYDAAFIEFLEQGRRSVLWDEDAEHLGLMAHVEQDVLQKADPRIAHHITLAGLVNRQNAWLVANGLQKLTGKPLTALTTVLNQFPGVARRFEQIADNIYSDYAHTPPKIRGALQLAREIAGQGKVVVVYEGLHNTRQHFILPNLRHLFDEVDYLYVVPSYLAREDPRLSLLGPTELIDSLSPAAKAHAVSADLNEQLAKLLADHADQGHTVLCLTAGGGGSLDEWLRAAFGT